MAVDGEKDRLSDDGSCAPGTVDLIEDILHHFQIGEPREVVMHGEPLAQDLMDRHFQGVV